MMDDEIDPQEVVVCPNEYGGQVGTWNGIVRSIFGECICAKLGATPCAYR